MELASLKAMVGSKDLRILQTLVGKKAANLVLGSVEKDLNGPEINLEIACRDLVYGTVRQCSNPHVYGYAIERLCEKFGKELSDFRLGSMLLFDETLGVFHPIFQRGSPIPIPPYHDLPSIGYLTNEEAKFLKTTEGNAENRELRRFYFELSELVEFIRLTSSDIVGVYS